jgi:hypothetical protein
MSSRVSIGSGWSRTIESAHYTPSASPSNADVLGST